VPLSLVPRNTTASAKQTREPPAPAGDGRALFRVEAAVVTASLTRTGAAEQVAPNVLALAHWARILEGELYASSARID
jgi:hypothetical protein